MRISFTLVTLVALGAFATGAGCGDSSSSANTGTPGVTGDASVAPDGGNDTAGDGGDDAGSAGDSGAIPDSSGGDDGGIQDGGSGDGGGIVDGSSDAAAGDGGTAAPAFPFPPVVASGGPVILAPKIVTITFPGDSMASQLATFGASVASSSYWDAIRAGYCVGNSCVGDGPAGTAVALTTAPAASYTDSSNGGASTLKTFLQGLITANTVPAPDANTLYTLYFPASTSISLDGANSCQAFFGYHDTLTVGNQKYPYAVIPECAPPQGLTLLQNTTETASHEFIEAATDPVSGFYLDLNNPATWGWNDIQGGEVGDLCVDPFGLGLDQTTENGFTVQRTWSIQNASAGKNPCVPIPAGEVYFNAYSQYSVVVLDVGQSTTIDVTALADGNMPAWTLTPQDWTDPQTTYLGFSMQGVTDAGSGVQVQSGDKVPLTVTLLKDPSATPNGEADAVLVSANGPSGSATAAHFWPFIVLTPAVAQDAGVTMMRPHERSLVSRPRGTRRRSLEK